MRVAVTIELTDNEQSNLERLARGRSTPARLVTRARIVLQAAKGLRNKAIASALGLQEKTVGLWRKRFCDKRIPGIEKDAPGRGRRRSLAKAKVTEIVRITTLARVYRVR